MPKKTVREMTALERMRYSLSARTFNSVLLLTILISVAAIAFGFFLYSRAVNSEYRTEAERVSKTAAAVVDNDEVRRLTLQVLATYQAMSEDEKGNGESDAYLDYFSHIMDDDGYKSLREELNLIREENDEVACYIAAADFDAGRLIYIIDSDIKQESFFPPGRLESVDAEELEAYENGAEVGTIESVISGNDSVNAVVYRDPEYGYRCTAATKICDLDKYKVYAFVDSDMNRAASASRKFLFQYLMVMLVIAVLADALLVQRLKKVVVKPINQLADAALSYHTNKYNRNDKTRYFQDLDIRTGDEIENLAFIMKDMESDLYDYIENLTNVTAEKERINTELNVASSIQEGIIPHMFPAFPERAEFDIYATMHTAKAVGGDFYDFFLIDEDHLAMVMADVSGKGIPAALFMMGSKIMINNYAMSRDMSPATILSDVNNSLCENNPQDMFVTVWLGIMEISTGKIRAANAGHEYPAIRHGDGSFELLKDKHGFVLGAMVGMKYKEYEIQLQPGDYIFQYTDGVTEATDAYNELFGTDRMIEALNKEKDAPPEKIIENVQADVDIFGNGVAQFDDITMLCLKYMGPAADSNDPDTDTGDNSESLEKSSDSDEGTYHEIEMDALVEKWPEALGFIEEVLEGAECPVKTMMAIDVAAEEIFVNIASYAYQPDTGKVRIGIDVSGDPTTAEITFTDSGIQYDPLAKEDPDVTLPAEERQIGGLGIYMVKQSMDDVSYEYRDGKNVLTIRKQL